MKRTLLLLFALCFCTALSAQNKHHALSDANVIGHVVDAISHEHLPGMTIQIKGTTFGTTTDGTGHYFLKNLKPGKITLVLRGVGYQSQEKEISVERGVTHEINFGAVEDVINMDEVVVTANRQETLRRLAPTVVSIADEKLFARINANNLLQGLSFQPGLRVENNCQNCGFNQVRINGLDGRYTQILIDSRPILSALAGIYGIEQIPTNMVERVEVVRGGGSALYGSSAIGGVVNIITKAPTGNSFSFKESLSFTGMSKSDNNVSFNASLVSNNNRAGAMVFGQARNRKPWDVNGDGFSELGLLNSQSFGTRTYLKTTDYTQLSTEFHAIREDRRGGDHVEELPDHVAAVSEHVRHTIYSGSGKFDLFSSDYKHHLQAFVSGQSVARESYYGGIGNQTDEKGHALGEVGYPIPKDAWGENNGHTNGLTINGGVQYSYDFKHLLFMPAQILVGAEYTYDHLHDRMPIRQWIPAKDENGNVIVKDGVIQSNYPALCQKLNIWSQLAQIEWKNDMFSFLFGTRLDEHSIVKKPIFCPRVTLRYNPIKDINLRASYAKGFRAPQLFDEDLHVSVVGGDAQKIINGKDLNPESSHSFNISGDFYVKSRGFSANFLVEAFFNRITAVFVLQEMPMLNDGIQRFERVNGQGARIYGANFEARLAWRFLQLQLGATIAENKYDRPEEWGEHALFDPNGMPMLEDGAVKTDKLTSDRIMRTPKAYGYFTLSAELFEGFNFALNGNITGPMFAPHVIEYGAGAAFSDRLAGNDASKFESYFVANGIDEKNRTIRIDELKKTPTFFELGTKLSYEFDLLASKIQVNAGISNMFNSMQKDYDFGASRDSAYIYGPLSPRTFYCGVQYRF